MSVVMSPSELREDVTLVAHGESSPTPRRIVLEPSLLTVAAGASVVAPGDDAATDYACSK
jgi:hypothetical protein